MSVGIKESEVTIHRPILRRDITLEQQGQNESFDGYMERILQQVLDQLPEGCPLKEAITQTGSNHNDGVFYFRSLPRGINSNTQFYNYPASIDFTEQQVFELGADHDPKEGLYASKFLTSAYFAPFPKYDLDHTITLIYQTTGNTRFKNYETLLGYLVTKWVQAN